MPRLVWTNCGDGLQCAKVRVPLDYDQPQGAQITLALMRLLATDPQQRLGSLFVNPGGPGGSAISEVRIAKYLFSADVRARYDIVGMDPRGVGESTPVRCFASTAEQQIFEPLIRAPSSLFQYAIHLLMAYVFNAACTARNGDLLNHLSTANVARDMDLMRQSVGDVQLNYYGISYGTYLGSTYAAMFPNRVRSMVLDGVVIAPAYRSGPSTPFLRQRGNVGAAATLDQFLRLCAQAGPGCPFAAGGDPSAKFAELAERVRAHPLALPDGTVVDYGRLLELTIGELNTASQWAALAQMLQDLYTANPSGQVGPTPPGAAPAAYDNTFDARLAIVCGETDNPNPLAYPFLAAGADRATPYAGSFDAYLTFGCSLWQSHDADRYTGSFQVRTANPVLVTSNRYDPATPYENAVDTVGLLSGSRLLTVNGWGHTVLTQVQVPPTPCALDYVTSYLLTGTLPPEGAQCGPNVVPFAAAR